MHRRWASKRQFLLRLTCATLISYSAVCGLMVWGEPYIMYQPRSGPTEPQQAGLPDYTRQTFTAPDQTVIPYWEHAEGGQAPIILYFHGNGGGLHYFRQPLAMLAAAHFRVMAMEYRGYPGAPGKPSEQAIVTDAIAFFDEAKRRYPNRPIAIWGYSLGTGVATQLAAARPPAALVLEAPFSATVDLASEMVPYFPVRHLMRDQYRSRDAITHVHAPVFIMHGETDRIVPIASGERLYNATNEPKQFHRYPGIGHLDLMNSPAYADAFRFLKTLNVPSSSARP